MNHRQPPSVARFVDGIRDAVRSKFETVASLGSTTGSGRDENSVGGARTPDRVGEHRTANRHGQSADAATGLESRGRSSDGSITAALVDADSGPTSRSEILEYGCSPAQYVRIVLAEHGGRVKQCRFADEYGWTPSTISRLLSDLEQRGVVDRYRVGREKVVALPDEQ